MPHIIAANAKITNAILISQGRLSMKAQKAVQIPAIIRRNVHIALVFLINSRNDLFSICAPYSGAV
jgi:hypothetical protein